MPKKVSLIEKRAWLAEYESGNSEASIAHKARRDVRTIKKGIEEARRERDTRIARADLIKEALRSHNESLLKLIRETLSTVKPPGSNQTIPWKRENISDLIRIDGGNVRYENLPELKVTSITLDTEDKTEWALLEEHLKPERSLNFLGQWKKALAAHLEARIAAKRKLANLLQEKTGCHLADLPISGSFLYSSSVDFLFQQMTQQLLQLADTSDLNSNIFIDTEKGNVRYGASTILAHDPRKERECRQHILDALKVLLSSDEAQSVIDTYPAVKDLTTKARQTLEEISLLGLVPGQCRVCRRLGM
jgi:hypothetical protein